MKVLLCHAYYTQRGGEDQSFEEERQLLRGAGVEVVEYTRRNEELLTGNSLKAAATTVWNRRACGEIATLVDRERPDVFHATNTFPSISPAVLRTARRRGAAVVQALRNYRILCAGAYLMREKAPCESCVGAFLPLAAVVNRCYRGSVMASAAVAGMQVIHRSVGTWQRYVDCFFTLTEFAKNKFVEAGFPADRIAVKNNCVHPDPGPGPGGSQATFVGRLSPEKGVTTLLEAWRLDSTLPTLAIVGDGPLAGVVREAAARDKRIRWHGELPSAEVHRELRQSLALVMPSVWYETFGRTIAEAFAAGTPVAASRLGAMAELVDDGRTGALFSPSDPQSLAQAVRRIQSLDAPARAEMRQAARSEFERRFAADRNLERLLEVYGRALTRRWPERARAAAWTRETASEELAGVFPQMMPAPR
jgi:glycosyltransferase involved in cell wall biosynthesis